MDQEEFIEKMKAQFPKDIREGDILFLSGWMKRNNFNMLQREALFSTVGEKHGYRTFPITSKIIAWWEQREASEGNNTSLGSRRGDGLYFGIESDMINTSRGYSPKKISDICKQIRDKYFESSDEITHKRQMFIVFWESLATLFDICIDKGWSDDAANAYCTPIKEKVLSREYISASGDCIEDKRSIEQTEKAVAEARMLVSNMMRNISKYKTDRTEVNRNENP